MEQGIGKVVILMGSNKDLDFCKKIAFILEKFEINYDLRIASAHKTPEKVIDIIKEYSNNKIVYITVAGRSNALSAFVDANTEKPVIACPPYSEKFSGADILSSISIPSGIGSLFNMEPEGAAIAAVKILALGNDQLTKRIQLFHFENKEKILLDDDNLRKILKK